jgi:peptidoglycan/xylan/chitin deacetylase (PgdA/CDA1 family)
MTSGNGRIGNWRIGNGRIGLGRAPMILMYHGVAAVASAAEDPNLLCVSPGRFAEQMAWLKGRGLRGVSIGELVDAMHAGRARGMVGITFDDGYLNVLEDALPVLRRYGFTATMFIIAGRLGGTNEWDDGPSWKLMDGAQVAELAEAGMEIGSHSASHVRLAGLPSDQLAAEVADSRRTLEDLLGKPVRGFAYPYGSMDAAARRAVTEAGYEYACAVETPLGALGLAALPRVYMGEQDTAGRMAAKRLLYRGYIAVKGRKAS